MLIGFFIAATLLSRFGEARKILRTTDMVAKGGERDAWQVLANGGVFAAMAAASLLSSSPVWLFAGAGAIAASSADTWATEIGVLSSAPPRSIVSGKKVGMGQSGGVSRIGTLAGAGGAALIALITFLFGWGSTAIAAALTGGIAGCVTDSLLGATLQVRRWCDRCNRLTERTVHGCGTTTRVAGGLPWLDNDAVNAVSSALGALVGMLCFFLSP